MWSSTELISSEKGWTLLRRMYVQRDELSFSKNNCPSCDICTIVCPKEALSFQEIEGEDKMHLTVDKEKCSFCGVCVASCLYKAFEFRTNDVITIPVEAKEVFPPFGGNTVRLNAENCIGCGNCVSSCPRGATSLRYHKNEPFIIFDQELCSGCHTCELSCGVKLIESNPTFNGTLELNLDQCKEDCSLCIDLCPMDSLINSLITNKAEWIEAGCTFCGACARICPENAIKVKREEMRPFAVESGVTTEAKKKLLQEE
ncbi:MAG: 4Fe-4S binding protein [Promethearchaeota archaeon]